MAKNAVNRTFREILDRSMELFNDHGVESVSILRVAQSLQISPGNLTYHFNKKNDLLDALLDRLEAELLQSFRDFPVASGASEFVQAYAGVFTTCWAYRGLFNSGPYLVQSGLVKASRYRALDVHIVETLVNHCKATIARNLMHPVPRPYGPQTLIDCIWWQWLGWLRINQINEPSQRIGVDEIISSGIRHTVFLIEPYMNRSFVTEVHKVLADKYPSSTAKRRTKAASRQPKPRTAKA